MFAAPPLDITSLKSGLFHFTGQPYLQKGRAKVATCTILLAIFLGTISAGNTKGGSITVPLTSCLTGLESAVWLLTIFVFIFRTD
jgi:hypothetical protein